MNTTTEIPTGKTRGQIAYEAYCEATNWKSLANGSALPQWLDVKDKIKEAWEKAGDALVAALPAVPEVHPIPQITVDERIRQEYPDLVPSGDHDLLGEVLGLLRVSRSQRDDAENLGQEIKKLADFLAQSKGLPGFEGSAVEVAIKIIGQYVPELHEQQELLARIVNELGLKSVDGAVEYIREMREANNHRPVKPPTCFAGITCKRTGRLIELRLAETGEVEQKQLDAVVDFLNHAGIGTH